MVRRYGGFGRLAWRLAALLAITWSLLAAFALSVRARRRGCSTAIAAEPMAGATASVTLATDAGDKLSMGEAGGQRAGLFS